MKAYDSMIFDLDGTIWDSREPVALARNNVVKKLGLNLPPFTAQDVQKTMGLPMDKVFVNLDKYGNTSAASVGLALDEAVAFGRVKAGDKVVLVAFGAGLTWAATAIEW